jgi:hypothetical protein
MKYAVEMGLDAMMCIPSFIKNGSFQKLIRVIYIQTQQGDLISLVLFLQSKESRIKIVLF